MVELLLRDERCKEFAFEFGVRVDRIVMCKHERRQQEHYERMRSSGMLARAGTGIFGPATGKVKNPKSVSPKEAIDPLEARGEDGKELRKPN
jgi:hypothetical protein